MPTSKPNKRTYMLLGCISIIAGLAVLVPFSDVIRAILLVIIIVLLFIAR